MIKSKKILLVDDDSISRTLLREILHDYTNVYEAEDGFAALSFLQRNPDTALVLLDIRMPHMDGFETLARIRLSPWLLNMPVLVISSANDEETELRALKLGATEFASKPYQSAVLRQRVTNILQIPQHQPDCLPGSFAHQMYDLSQSQACGLCVYEFLPDYTIHTIFFNDAYAALCGYTHEEYDAFVREGSALQRTIHPEDQTAFRQAVETLITDRQPVYQTLRLQCKDGSLRSISINAKIYAEIMGRVIFHIVSLDLTCQTANEDSILHIAAGESAFDPLTDIYNRTAFFDQTRRLLDEHPGSDYILVVWDIDRFKVVNDLFGTRVGDNILIQVATHLRKHVLGIGTFGRLESDFFVFCLPAASFELEQMLKIQASLCASFGIHYNLTMHNGLYLINDPHVEISAMCDRARMALSTVKDNYILRYAYYNENMRQAMLTEQQILNDMHRALDEGEFVIYLQPIYSLNFDKPVSAEVLVRWQHPLLGIISPAQFIPLFEKNRFISEIDRYIWDLACKYLAGRQQQNLPVLPISVNVSRANLAAPELADELLALMDKYQLKPSLLRLEITESAYMENPLQLISASRRLQKAGFKIMLDDFGSGYSSLKMLKDIPLDILKIDMRFLEDLDHSPRAAAILLGVINIAQHLDMITVAEGVETKFQLDFLRTTGCDNIQGFYYSKPLPVREFDRLLANPPLLL